MMQKKTHYQVLNIDKNASIEVVKLAYERLLNDAKNKLEDSPLFFEKEKTLKEAYLVLSNPQRRNYYDNKLIRGRIKKSKPSINDSISFSDFFSNIFSSKIFWAALASIALLIFILPSSQKSVIEQQQKQQQQILINYQDMQKRQIELIQQKERYYSGAIETNQEAYKARAEKRKEQAEQHQLEREIEKIAREEKYAEDKIAREERSLARKKQREQQQAEKKLARQLVAEKKSREQRQRQQQYEAEMRSRKLIQKYEYEEYQQQRNKKISSGSL
ncbi:MAG: DnaJ domain-containing protein [Pseudomonadota bacterium]